MKSKQLVALAALAAAFSLPAQDGGKSAADAAAKPAAASSQTIGVIDFAKAIEQYPKYVQMTAEIDSRRTAAKNQLQNLQKETAEKVEALRMVNQDSEEARDRAAEIELARNKQKLMAESLDRKIQLEEMRLLFEVYQDLEVAVAKVAKARGVDVVLRLHSMETVDVGKLVPRDLQRRLELLDRRQVWYSSESVDLTADVIKLLMVPLPEKEKKDTKAAEKPPAAPAPKSGG
jgi:Skp family chaperone for outer membrane proteins